MTDTDFGEPLDTTLGALRRKIRSDGWIADTKGVLEESLEEGPAYVSSGDEFDNTQDLVAEFQEGWQETDHFRINYMIPLKKAIQDTHSNWDLTEIRDLMTQLLQEAVWEAYHKENDTYDIAKELMKKSKKDLEEVT